MMKSNQDDDLAIIAEIARMYYIEGMRQQEIGEALYFSKAKVSRALKFARDKKIIEFQVNYPLKRASLLEYELKRLFSLDDVLVVTNLVENLHTELSVKRITELAAEYLDQILQDGDVVGLSWGRTLHGVISQLKPKSPKDIQIIQVIGSSSKEYKEKYDCPNLVQEMAKAFQGKYSLLYAPMHIYSDIARKELLKEKVICESLKRIEEIDYLITGIADISQKLNTNTLAGFMDEKTKKEVLDKGAVGYLCGYIFDQKGEMIQHDFNKKVIGISFEQIKKQKNVIAIAGGIDKTNAIYAAIEGKLINRLITDGKIAEKLIMMRRKELLKRKGELTNAENDSIRL